MKRPFPSGRRLDIRTKVLTLVGVSALVPALIVGSASYLTARRILVEKIDAELSEETGAATDDLAAWIEGRLRDGQVFASPFLLSDALRTWSQAPEGSVERRSAQRRVEEYLEEVRSRSPLDRSLVVLDEEGGVVARSGGSRAEAAAPLVRGGEAVLLSGLGEAAELVLRLPVVGDEGETLGELEIVSRLAPLWELLVQQAPASTRLLVFSSRGLLFDSSGGEGDPTADLASVGVQRCFAGGTGVVSYRNSRAQEVVGGYRLLERFGTGVVLEMDRTEAFAAVDRLRDFTLLICLLTAALVTAGASALVVSLTQPIRALTAGAQAVAEGELEQEIPVTSGDEIGYLTEVFNDMTWSLREIHARLAELSNTDELTGLMNRRHLAEVFETELARARRSGDPLAVLMIDLDHFKDFNDRHGHLRGDDVLRGTAELFRSELRPGDVAARYGGEEFAILLPKTGEAEAARAADRLRSALAAQTAAETLTASIGVAVWPRDGEGPDALVEQADRALYRAKRRGRNCVVMAGDQEVAAAVGQGVGASSSTSPR